MISKAAKNKSNFKNELKYFNSAREGWSSILTSLKIQNKVLLPSYIGVTDREGSGIFDPIKSAGVSFDFYQLNDDLSISLNTITSKIKDEKIDLILLVHYFGFKIKNIEEIVNVCKENKVIVVEDCAHLYNYNLYNYSKAGTYGDFAFYSLHKFLPIDSGGMVVCNNKAYNLKNTDKDLKINYASQVLSYNVKEIANKRIENYKHLDTLICKLEGVKSLKKIDDGDIPHNYPIIVKNQLREKLYFWLIEKDITLIALYYRLIKPICSEKFANTHFLSKNILNLPIHQDVQKFELDNLVKLLAQGLNEIKA